jgi:hypothetical protein
MAGHRLGRADHQLAGVVAERALHRRTLGDVAQRRRRAVRIDVVDLRGGHARVLQRVQHRAASTIAVFRRRRDVMGVGRHAVAGKFAIDPRAARLGVLVLLERHDAGALAQHEAVAVAVPGPARRGRIVVAGRQRARSAEAADAERADGRFGATRQHHVGIAVLDQPRGLADAVVRGRAGSDRREVRTLVAVVDRHQAGDHVDDRARHEERADFAQAAAEIRACRVLDHRQPADAGADAHANAFLVAGVVLEARVAHRFHGRDQAVVDEGVVAAGLLRVQVLADVEVLDLARDARRERRCVEAGDRTDARTRGEDGRPRGLDADADRRNDAETGDDDAATWHEVDRSGKSATRGGRRTGRVPAPGVVTS